jgi:hypothetical protein
MTYQNLDVIRLEQDVHFETTSLKKNKLTLWEVVRIIGTTIILIALTIVFLGEE